MDTVEELVVANFVMEQGFLPPACNSLGLLLTIKATAHCTILPRFTGLKTLRLEM